MIKKFRAALSISKRSTVFSLKNSKQRSCSILLETRKLVKRHQMINLLTAISKSKASRVGVKLPHLNFASAQGKSSILQDALPSCVSNAECKLAVADMRMLKRRRLHLYILPAAGAIELSINKNILQTSQQQYTERRVRFSVLSSFRSICNYEESLSEAKSVQSTSVTCNLSGRSSSETTEASDESVSNFQDISDSTVPTKVTDGPPPATLATQKLLLILKNERKINRNQVLYLLRTHPVHVSEGSDLVAHPREPLDDLPEYPTAEQQQPPAPSLEALTAQVLARLHSLAERIDARGRASLLPCTTRVGRPFLPAIRFLASCIPAAGAPETKTAQGGPAHVSAV